MDHWWIRRRCRSLQRHLICCRVAGRGVSSAFTQRLAQPADVDVRQAGGHCPEPYLPVRAHRQFRVGDCGLARRRRWSPWPGCLGQCEDEPIITISVWLDKCNAL